jgi:hypothetical protein
MGDECYEDVIMGLIKSKKTFEKSYFGAFPELKEFDRHEEEDDRIGDQSFPQLQKGRARSSSMATRILKT